MADEPLKTFRTREEAEAARDRLNEAPPEHGYGEWYLGGGVEGPWHVLRWRGLMAEQIGDAKAFEESHRAAFEETAMDHEYWRDLDGIRFEAVELHGSYPDTMLALLFRSVPSPTAFGTADPDCLFGFRWPIWPASDADPAEQARQLLTTFDEFLGTDSRAERVRGVGDCDTRCTNWLN